MQYTATYSSPLGEILLAAEEESLTGLWFAGQKHFARTLAEEHAEGNLPVFDEARRWLDLYFAGNTPVFTPPLSPKGTDFERAVWNLLLMVPHGETTTYGELARRYAAEHGLDSMSARAIGSAVGRNPISIIIPCHRVLGANGSLTGYAGGTDRKKALLEIEKEAICHG